MNIIRYRESAAGRATLIFLHAGLASIRSWGDLPALLAARWPGGAIAYDRKGHGGSAGKAAFPADFFNRGADELARLIAAASVGPVILIGNSDGATIALCHALREAGSKSGEDVVAVVSIAGHIRRDSATEAGIRELRARNGNTAPSWMGEIHGEDRAAGMFAGWCDRWLSADFGDWDMTADLGRLACPLLAIQGGRDEFALPGHLDDLAAAAPVARKCFLPGNGHFPHLEDPGKIAGIVAEFVSGVAARETRV